MIMYLEVLLTLVYTKHELTKNIAILISILNFGIGLRFN
jgi:hypothetical protein